MLTLIGVGIVGLGTLIAVGALLVRAIRDARRGSETARGYLVVLVVFLAVLTALWFFGH